MRRAEMGLTQIVLALIVFAAVMGGSKVVWDLTSKPAAYLLGRGDTDAFDNDIKERYNKTVDMNQKVADSVRGLMFAINHLAYVDTYKDDSLSQEAINLDFTDEQGVSFLKREFGSTTVTPTYYDQESVFIGADESFERGREELAIGAISCWLIFRDKGNENTRCYYIRFDENYQHFDELNNFNENRFIEYLEDNKGNVCRAFTQRYKYIPLSECVDMVSEITGDSLNPFNVENIEYLPDNFFGANREVNICGNNEGLNEIFFHQSSRGDICEAPTDALSFGYRVSGFELPQNIGTDSRISYTVEETLTAFGDPQYILFYEKFPKEEAVYWETSSFATAFGAIVATEVTVTVATLGIGKLFRPLMKPLRGLVQGGIETASLFSKLVPFRRQIASLGIRARDLIVRFAERSATVAANAGTRAKHMLRYFALEMGEIERAQIMRRMAADADKTLASMSPNEARRFMVKARNAKDLVIDNQGRFIVDTSSTISQVERDLALRHLDEIAANMRPNDFFARNGLLLQQFSSGVLEVEAGIIKNTLSNKKHMLAMAAAIVALQIESSEGKYYPVGTNALGLKSPYEHTLSYDQFDTGVEYSDINSYLGLTGASDAAQKETVEDHKRFAKEILNKYGQSGFEGLLPEVNRYYLSLTKDQGLFDQDPSRFHLVSPCKTDMLIEVSACTCGYEVNEEEGVYRTGESYPLYDLDSDGNRVRNGYFTEYAHFDGQNAMLYNVDINGDAVKQCHPKGSFDDLYKPSCIKINPLVDNFEEQNYCYHGLSTGDTIAKNTIFWVGEVGLTAIAALLCNACAIPLGAVFFIVGETAQEVIDVTSKWPEHD